MSLYLYLDIETVPDEGRRHLWGLPEIPDPLPDPHELVTTRNANAITDFLKRYAVVLDHDYLEAIYDEECKGKNRSTIRTAITKAFEAETALIKELSLDPERCRIAAIGVAIGEHPPIAECPAIEDEWKTLNYFWTLLKTHTTLVGYNLLGFDLPVICARSIMLGVRPTLSIDWRKYGNQQVIDLMLARFPYGKYKSLKDLATQYDIEIPKPDADGSLVHQMSPEEIAEYVKSDVIVTRELHRKFAGFFCDRLVEKKEEPF